MATTIKYDNTDVETGGGGEHAQPGVYAGKIVSVTHRTQKSNGQPANDLEVVLDIGPDYRRLWTYIGLDKNTAWKMREFTDAVDLPPKGELTAAKLKALINKPVTVKVAADTDLDGEYRGKVKNLFKPGEGGVAPSSGSGSAGDDYDEWDDAELAEEVEKRDLTISGRKSKQKLIDALREDDEANVDGGGDGGDDGGDDAAAASDDPQDEYDEWTIDDLKEELGERGIEIPKGRLTETKLVALLREADAGGGDASDGGGSDAPDAPGDSYDDESEWSDTDLQDEINDRNEQGAEIEVKGRKTRAKLIEALRADDNSAPF